MKTGKDVTIEDDTYAKTTWDGKIDTISPWFTQKRNMIAEPFTYDDARYQECVVGR